MRRILAALAAVAALGQARPAAAFEFFDGRLSVHGYAELQMRGIGEDFHPENANLAQWANILNLEIEADLAPDGIGPFDAVSAFARVLVRYDCIYTGCGMLPTWRYYGDRANRVPRNLATARNNPFSGRLLEPDPDRSRFHRGHELLTIYDTPLLRELQDFGAANLQPTFAPIDDARFAVKDQDASVGNGFFILGPWNPDVPIDPDGTLDTVPDDTIPLPLRPAVGAPRAGGLDPHGLFVPSAKYVRDFGDWEIEQNYSEADLAWHHVQSQDERELKELFIDAELFDGRLWLRLGKQSIVWGKTELFRTTDQFNPQTLALSSLPSLEESRIALWSVRGTWSFYTIGPLEDVRLEIAANLDDFEPLDLGRCGTPYTVWLVCGKTFGYYAHGFAGAGLVGERRPDSPWSSVKGLEVGARVEFRWDRFSFQISDFWGYEDAPTLANFNEYERRVDWRSGRPLDVNGDVIYPDRDPDSVLRLHPANRQLFGVVCSSTKGIAGGLSDVLAERCLVDIPNSDANLAAGITPALALSRAVGGSAFGEGIIQTITGLAGSPVTVDLVQLNRDPNDGPGAPTLQPNTTLSAFLTDQQEALFGCGAFYGTNCDIEGFDLFNAEASVLVQAFPQFEIGRPVATRFVPGEGLVILPGARGPADARYDPLVDGCVAPGPFGCNAGDLGRAGPATSLLDPRTGELLRNELAAASYNFMVLLAALGAATGNDPACRVEDAFTCAFVRGVFAIAGSRRPEVRAGGNGDFGRRDFIWSSGSEVELRYLKRNVLGFATDFAHDGTGTNWSIEATWIAGQPYGIQSEPRGWGRRDTYNLTLSVDRPTFINFLNSSRTFFFNSQVFLRWIDDYVKDDAMSVHGPWSVLGTFTILTGYY
ncbi:MAG: hypothetical protein DCC71_18640 [Proteobacteria bacterium]|nr:MAG: hypothetical protein DCC71_18640 [Pseudomonadota bacterium]